MNYPDPVINYIKDNVYTPSDDTYLLLDHLKQNITPIEFDGIKIQHVRNILDMGTGTGILAILLQIVKTVNLNFNANIFASDINQNALISAKRNEKLNGLSEEITFIKSNLFGSFPESLKGRFDIIIFNPPYLPSIEKEDIFKSEENDRSWEGGIKGFEIFLKFLVQVKKFMNFEYKSFIYYISSSKTDLKELDRKILEQGFKNEEMDKKHVFFEDIILNRLTLKTS
ncbi:MAG: HemK2/MTQ2 family protein methyltransferase [Promethearchaeati archaeon]